MLWGSAGPQTFGAFIRIRRLAGANPRAKTQNISYGEDVDRFIFSDLCR